MTTAQILTQLALGPLILSISLLYRSFKPKNINWAYGYRTVRSMKSEHTWKYANELASGLMVWASVVTMVFQIIFFLTLDFASGVMATCIVMVIAVIAPIPYVEKKLRENFDKEGNPKT